MRERPKQVERHGMLVWENGTAEAVRKEECLCLHCDSMRPGSQEHCPIAQQFYKICKIHGTAFVLSRVRRAQKLRDTARPVWRENRTA